MEQTAEDVKKGLECRLCDEPADLCGEDCPCWSAYSPREMYEDKDVADALALIQQLQAENTEKDQRIRQLEAERDALIEELKNAHSCFACKKFHRNGGECKAGGVCMMRDFEWRGLQT